MTRPLYTPSQLGSIVERGKRAGYPRVRTERLPDGGIVIEFSDTPAPDVSVNVPVSRSTDSQATMVGPWVYFIDDGTAIKIGFATDVEKRLLGLQTSSHRTLTVLLVVMGSRQLERRLHRKFRSDHIRGEWFHRSDALLAFIDKERKSWRARRP